MDSVSFFGSRDTKGAQVEEVKGAAVLRCEALPSSNQVKFSVFDQPSKTPITYFADLNYAECAKALTEAAGAHVDFRPSYQAGKKSFPKPGNN